MALRRSDIADVRFHRSDGGAAVISAKSWLIWLIVALMGAVQAMAQPSPVQEMVIDDRDGTLQFVHEGNCGNGRPSEEVCITGPSGAQVVFRLASGAEGWRITGMRIRDPALNWRDKLPARAAADFPGFDREGVLQAEIPDRQKLTIRSNNRYSQAVQFAVTLRKGVLGERAVVYGVIDSDGGAAAQAD
ncbi:MAG: hypothetical protein R3348_05035 [Xanthomonadales bacterium]|nr:hypothetical protein [Xanthomonadales bacterium]